MHYYPMYIRTIAVFLSIQKEISIQEYFGGCQLEMENSFNKYELFENGMSTFCSTQ